MRLYSVCESNISRLVTPGVTRHIAKICDYQEKRIENVKILYPFLVCMVILLYSRHALVGAVFFSQVSPQRILHFTVFYVE